MQQRRQKIVELINREGQISFSRLKMAFPEVSEMTLRTDLKNLDEMGAIIRVHGGARSMDTLAGTDGTLTQRTARNVAPKNEIAIKARSLLRSGASLFIDSGSTTTAFCRQLPNESRQIYTSGLSCAMELCALDQPKIHITGGQVSRDSISIVGAQSVLGLRNCHFDICFLGTTSFSPEHGFCCEHRDDALLKSVAIHQSDYVVVLMDSGKYGLSNTHCFAELSDVDAVVSDSALTAEQKKYFLDHGVMVL